MKKWREKITLFCLEGHTKCSLLTRNQSFSRRNNHSKFHIENHEICCGMNKKKQRNVWCWCEVVWGSCSGTSLYFGWYITRLSQTRTIKQSSYWNPGGQLGKAESKMHCWFRIKKSTREPELWWWGDFILEILIVITTLFQRYFWMTILHSLVREFVEQSMAIRELILQKRQVS